MTGGRYSVAEVLRDVDPAELVTICAADQKPRNIYVIWSNGNGKQGGRLARGKHTVLPAKAARKSTLDPRPLP
jgi:hypothetical protein